MRMHLFVQSHMTCERLRRATPASRHMHSLVELPLRLEAAADGTQLWPWVLWRPESAAVNMCFVCLDTMRTRTVT